MSLHLSESAPRLARQRLEIDELSSPGHVKGLDPVAQPAAIFPLMRNLAPALMALALSLPAWGCGDANAGGADALPVTPPTISDLELPSSAIIGDTAEAFLTVRDPGGLAGSKIEAKLQVGEQSAVSVVALSAPAALTEARVTVFLQFAVPGEYAVALTAIDADGERSNTLSGVLPVSAP